MSSLRDIIIECDPLASAILREDLADLRDVLESGVSVNYAIPHTVNTPLMLAVGKTPLHTHMVNMLLECDADIERGESFHGVTPLSAACNLENLELAKLLIGKGARVNVCTGDRKTPLMNMAKLGNTQLIELLLDAGADIWSYDEQAMNALIHACSEGKLQAVELLLERGANVNDYKVDPPIWYACARGHVEIVNLLIARGAKIEYRLDGTIYSTTPLMEACEWGHYAAVKELLENGADACGRTGRKAKILAQKSGYHEVVALMDVWQKRLKEIEANACNLPPTLLPNILSLTAKRHDLAFDIISKRGDVVASGWGDICH